jgi:hypothetical protein
MLYDVADPASVVRGGIGGGRLPMREPRRRTATPWFQGVVAEALERLPATSQRVVRLCFCLDPLLPHDKPWSLRKIAGVLNLSPEAVLGILKEALVALRREIGDLAKLELRDSPSLPTLYGLVPGAP